MKSMICSRLAVNILMMTVATIPAMACGPYYPIIPTPEFFESPSDYKSMAAYEKEENLRLWQSLTSERIPLSDIEEAVYETSSDDFYDYTGYRQKPTDNLFFIYLNNSRNAELGDLLRTAKRMEEKWHSIRSPWYYPSDRDANCETGDFHDIIEVCKAYNGTRLKDRYGLQAVRAYFASRDYSGCIQYYDSFFNSIPDDNLMKRMAGRYVAGCWSRLGDTQRADSLFAVSGDIWSISNPNPVEYMARYNPSAPQLMSYIRNQASDTAFMKETAILAKKILADKRVKDKGDWNFLMAYVNNEYSNNRKTAAAQIRQALSQEFSSAELADLARAYKMKIDAQCGNRNSLLADLKWIEGKADVLNPEAHEWVRRLRNVIYAEWIPYLWRKKEYHTAILLCSYADKFSPDDLWHEAWENVGWHVYFRPTVSLTHQEMRESEVYANHLDYSCLSFQLMGSLTSTQLAVAYKKIMSDTPLFSHLRTKARTDVDYYNELIGTLSIREENFDRAVKYLSKVSHHYQRTMNIYKEQYLTRDPFSPYPKRWTKSEYSDWEWECQTSPRNVSHSQLDAKLQFAQQMKKYKNTMKRGKNNDERAMARLMYAIGRRNSLEECWALTQYWRGECTGIFEPALQYWEDDFPEKHYAFLYDYETTIGHKTTEREYQEEIDAAMSMFITDEARAKAEYHMRNLITIVKLYGNTTTAQHVKTSCDNWRDWL